MSVNLKNMEQYDGGNVRFGNNDRCLIKGKGSIVLPNRIKCEKSYWLESLRQNILSVAQFNKILF